MLTIGQPSEREDDIVPSLFVDFLIPTAIGTITFIGITESAFHPEFMKLNLKFTNRFLSSMYAPSVRRSLINLYEEIILSHMDPRIIISRQSFKGIHL